MSLPELLPAAEVAQIISDMRCEAYPQNIQKPAFTRRARIKRDERHAKLEDAAIADNNYQLRGVFLLGA